MRKHTNAVKYIAAPGMVSFARRLYTTSIFRRVADG